jgi:uncharacterized protein YacL
MSFPVILRLFLTLCMALVGWAFGLTLIENVGAELVWHKGYYRLVGVFGGGLIGFIGAPYILGLPFRALCNWLRKIPAQSLIMGVIGVSIGLVIASLLSIPLAILPDIWGDITPLVAAVLLASLGALTLVVRDRDILAILGMSVARDAIRRKREVSLLDTSVIIDGRIADICQAGFMNGTMVVPRFVLDELQHIADSSDDLRRSRGRRGLDILNRMQKDTRVPLEILERDPREIREVDGKLVRLAQELNCPIVTNDYNLNRVAELQNVHVLNINELANAVKAVVLPGESLRLRIIQEGKELGQGVGYLDDGTMVVVEDGRRHINMTVNAVVTRVLQTVAGRMIFCQLQDNRR